MARENAGYEIICSFPTRENEEVVLGKSKTNPDHYVTWECVNGNNYMWGHYITHGETAAKEDFLARTLECIRMGRDVTIDYERSGQPSGLHIECLIYGAYYKIPITDDEATSIARHVQERGVAEDIQCRIEEHFGYQNEANPLDDKTIKNIASKFLSKGEVGESYWQSLDDFIEAAYNEQLENQDEEAVEM